jgi:hypothetical protein
METPLTELEAKLLRRFIKNDYIGLDFKTNPEQFINFPTWSFTITNSNKSDAGALGSLVKKGFVICHQDKEGESAELTKEGVEQLKLLVQEVEKKK